MAARHASLFVALMLAAAAVGVHGWGPQAPRYRPDKPIAIVGGLLIDATGAPPRMDQTVVIRALQVADDTFRIDARNDLAIGSPSRKDAP